jgi:hypothetical protein
MQARESKNQSSRRLSKTRRTAFFGTALLLCAGCHRSATKEDSPQASAVKARGPGQAPIAAATQVALSAQQPAPANDFAQPSAPTEQAAPIKAADEPEARDFTAELEHMMGSPAACLKPRADAPSGPATVSVTANVMPSGAVRHGEASSGALQPEELACIRRQLEGLHFAPPIPDGPFAVHGTLKLERPNAPHALAPIPKPGTDNNALAMPNDNGVSRGVVPPEDPGVVPTPDPGVVPPEDPGVVPPEDRGVLPTPDPGVIPTPDAPGWVANPEPSEPGPAPSAPPSEPNPNY